MMAQALAAAVVQAQLPMAESFETYPPGISIDGTNGWTAAGTGGVVTDAAGVMTALSDWAGRTGCGYPLPDEAHTRALRFDAAVSNQFGVALESSLWFDLMVSAEVWTHAMPPAIAPGVLFAFYTAPTGRLMAACSSGISPDAVNQWSELSGIVPDESGWMRLSVNLVQGPDSAFYAVRIDGGAPITHPAAFTDPSETAAPGGIWFPCANFHSRLVPIALSLSGSGVLDDFTVSGDRPSFESLPAAVAVITTLLDGDRGAISTDTVIVAPPGTNAPFLITADPYFHIRDILTNGTPIAGSDFESEPTNRYAFTWMDVSAGNHVLEILFAPDLTAAGTPHWWLASYYQTNDFDGAALDDGDADGFPAWKEHLAGTDPTDPDSLFRILETGMLDGTNYIIWAGGGGTGLPPFTIYRRTCLMGGTWEPVGEQRRSSSTRTVSNIWLDPAAPPGAFYRIGITPTQY
jgi:hypothetical protein